MPPTRYYQRDPDDKINGINRCFTDAEQGRIQLAFLRIADLLEEFPNDASVLYARGLIQRDFLGCGLKAREDFERASRAARPGEEVRGLATCNVATLARSYEEFDKWSAAALKILPKDRGVISMRSAIEEAKSSEADYHATLVNFVVATPPKEQLNRPGAAAAAFDVALAGQSALRTEEEVEIRKHRAQLLRQLDRRAEETHEMLLENFPSEERLALQGALEELERALALEDSDAELWNFHAAWCSLLRRDEEAIRSADKAIALRPHGYAKPWINKANALLHLKQFDGVRKCGEEAASQAQAAGLDADLRQAQELASITGTGHEVPDEDAFTRWIENFLTAATLTSKKEVSQKGWSGKYSELSNGFLKRVSPFGSDWHPSYIRIVAEMLIYFSPETCRIALIEARSLNEAAYENALNALLYLIVNSSGPLQRDSTRLLCLMFLGTGSVSGGRKMYRQAVLETAGGSAEFQRLPEVVRNELARINSWLPKFVADQEPVNEEEIAHARRTVLWRFNSTAIAERATPALRPWGCATLIVVVAAVVWIIWRLL